MSILQAYSFDNLRSLGGIDLKTLGMSKLIGVYYTSSSWPNPPMVNAEGWLCGADGNGVGEYRGQFFDYFMPDKTKVFWFGARFRNTNNGGYGIFRFQNDAGTVVEPMLSNHASLGLAGGTGTPEVFLEIEINYPENFIRFYKDGVKVFDMVFSAGSPALYTMWGAGARIAFGVLFKNATAYASANLAHMVRDISVVVDDGVGVTKRMGPVNIKSAPIIVDGVVGADKTAAASQTTLNQPITNTASGGAFAKPSGVVKLSAANSAVNFRLDLTNIPGKRLAAAVLVGARRASGAIPTVEASQTVNGTTYKDTVPLTTTNTNQDYVSWTNPRSEFAAANVDLATANFSLTLKDPA